MKPREIIKHFKPYEWELSSEEISRRLGLRPDQILRFDMNTSPFTPIWLQDELTRILQKLRVNEYPEASYSELREALSNYINRKPDEIMVTVGSDEALDIIAKVFVDPLTKVLISTPTYDMYRIVTETLGGVVVGIDRKSDFTDDLDEILKAMDGETRLIFLCNPNNPTGNLTPKKIIVELLEKSDCPVVVDEAYIEFCNQTIVDLVEQYENLMVIRTFSKALSLAGARVGYVVANKKTIGLLNVMRPPNSLSVISLTLAKIVLNNIDRIKKDVEMVVKERERVIQSLKNITIIHVYPSQTNFILTKFTSMNVSQIHEKLLKKGLVLRTLNKHPLLENCLRIAIRKPEENDVLLKELKTVLA